MNEWLAAVVGGIVGGLTSYLFQTFLNIKNEDVAVINNHISDIDRIERAATEYWLCDASQNQGKAEELAAILSGCLAVSGCFNAHAAKLLGYRYSDYKLLDDDLFDLATGGDFQVAGRNPDLQRVTSIITACHSLRLVLKHARRARFWAH